MVLPKQYTNNNGNIISIKLPHVMAICSYLEYLMCIAFALCFLWYRGIRSYERSSVSQHLILPPLSESDFLWSSWNKKIYELLSNIGFTFSFGCVCFGLGFCCSGVKASVGSKAVQVVIVVEEQQAAISTIWEAAGKISITYGSNLKPKSTWMQLILLESKSWIIWRD